jgi:uncharacterized protein YjbI with pentapeptide repeats
VSDLIARHDVDAITGRGYGAALQAARDAARGRLVTFGAGLFAAGALIYTARNFTLSRRTFELTEQGQVTDRFTKAIEQLGSDKLDVRIGGIYALERVARDSAKDHPIVMEVLTAFIREHSREPWPPPDTGSSEQGRLTRPDVQAAVTVVGRRDAERDIRGRRVDLTAAHLTSAQLVRAHLDGANLTGAYLDGANLLAVHLAGADLTDAQLTGAHLIRAHLDDAEFTGANLTGAHLVGVHLDGAHLIRARLDGAEFAGANLTGARWPEGARVPEGWMVDGDSGCLKRTGQLSEVTAHYPW